MIVLHLGVISTTPAEPEPTARAAGVVTAAYGVAMAFVHIGEGATGTAFTVFAKGGPLPRDLIQNLFGGSVALGLLIAAVGLGGWTLARRCDPKVTTPVGAALIALGLVMFLTYDSEGTFLGLGSTTASATVLAALGLALSVGAKDRVETSGTETSASSAG